MKTRIPRKAWLAVVVLMLASGAPVEGAPKAPKGSSGVAIEGDIVAEKRKAAVGAVVSAIHLESSKVYRAEPASGSGHFQIRDLPHGYYQLAVMHAQTLHAATVPVNVPPGARLKLGVTLLATAPVSETGEPVTLPILDQSATAGAEIDGMDRKPFFKTKAGVATLIGGSAGLLLLATR